MEKYDDLKIIGKGAYGDVYLCKRVNDCKPIIIKSIPMNEMNPREIQTALNEAQVLKMFHHSNIIQYFESFISNQSMMIVMEYAPGGTLAQYLIERNGELLPEKRILHLFSQIVVALHHVHSHKILHRDLKTANILLSKDKSIVKLGDFGISIILSTRSKAITVVGTPCYLSPEQCQGKPYGRKSDNWALGCILYEMATLRKAFEADSLQAVILKIFKGIGHVDSWQYSSELWGVIKNLLDLNPAKRWSTEMIMAQPLLINPIIDLYTDIGKTEPSCNQISK